MESGSNFEQTTINSIFNQEWFQIGIKNSLEPVENDIFRLREKLKLYLQLNFFAYLL